jgi:hypothetical protein
MILGNRLDLFNFNTQSAVDYVFRSRRSFRFSETQNEENFFVLRSAFIVPRFPSPW